MADRSKHQIIYADGAPAFAVIPWAEYKRLLPEAEMTDEALYDLAMAEAEESFPAEVVDRLLAGDSPIKVYREHRGLTQRKLAERAGINPVYLSQLETGRRRGGLATLRRIADALGVDLDDLVT